MLSNFLLKADAWKIPCVCSKYVSITHFIKKMFVNIRMSLSTQNSFDNRLGKKKKKGFYLVRKLIYANIFHTDLQSKVFNINTRSSRIRWEHHCLLNQMGASLFALPNTWRSTWSSSLPFAPQCRLNAGFDYCIRNGYFTFS